MVMSCAAYGCTNRVKKGENKSFHGFPTDPILCKKWILATKRQGFKPTKYSKLCSDHFECSDFVYNFGKKALKPGVVPTIFNFPEHLEKKLPKKRSKRLEKTVINKPEEDDTITKIWLPSPSAETLIEFIPEYNPTAAVINSLSGKRKRSKPVFMGDISSEDLVNPKKFKTMWQIANKTIDRQKKTIMFLRTRVKRLQKKLNSLQDLVEHLKK